MLLVIDNYDSFTWNLVQHLGELGADPIVVRNDEASAEDLLAEGPDHIVVSPGPCTPADAGISVEIFQAVGGDVPMLGVCLGHQALGEAFGGRTVSFPEDAKPGDLAGQFSPMRSRSSSNQLVTTMISPPLALPWPVIARNRRPSADTS